MDRIAATVASIGIAASLAWSVVPADAPSSVAPGPSPEPAILREAAVPAGVVDSPSDGAPHGAVSIVGGAPDEQALIESLLDRYRDAGLELPSLVVTIDPTRRACKDNNGLYRATAHGDEIAICHASEYVVLHELAHAWERHALDDAERNAYVEAHELPSWSDPDSRWRLRGIEHIANTLASALGGDGTGCSGPLGERYESLTGLDCPTADVSR